MYKFKLNDPKFLPHTGADLEFNLPKGSCLIITGNNGVGKSTLMRRFYETFHRESVLVDQSALDLFYDRSLRKIKNIFLDARGEEINRELFEELWKNFSLSLKEERLQSTLSGGEGQLLKLILGLTIKSDIYLLDEPSHYLDEKMKEALNDVLASLLNKGKSLILIEHDLSWITFHYEGIKLEDKDEKVKVVKQWNT